MFQTGHIKLKEVSSSKNKVYEILCMKIAVGKSYCMPSKSQNYKLPSGFDSIYLYDEDDEQTQGFYKHNYILFDNFSVLPMYIVTFEFDKSREEGLSVKF